MLKTLGIVAAALAGLWVGTVAAEPQGGQREAVVYRSSTCGCCKGWVTYLKRNGYTVTEHVREDMDVIKDELKVPEAMRSCHTAKIDGYVIEGHVPVEAIDKLLAEKPKVTGIAAPGMPSGSPGMNGPKEPNPIHTFKGSSTAPFATY